MPAALPGATLTENLSNPSAGRPVIFDALSGPKGSPFDNDNSGNASTGALCTGIGYGCTAGNPYINLFNGAKDNADAIRQHGFNDDSGIGGSAGNSSIIYIGGGRSNADGSPNAYTAGFTPGNAGNGGSRDAGSGPAYTCFVGKWVTANGPIANGSAVEAGWTNRSGVSLAANQSVFGSSTSAQAAPA
jgi:hypothetical protein